MLGLVIISEPGALNSSQQQRHQKNQLARNGNPKNYKKKTESRVKRRLDSLTCNSYYSEMK